MAEMTAETKAFFAREDVRAFVEKMRAEWPSVSFYRNPGNECIAWTDDERGMWCGHERGMFWGSARRHHARALVEGRALIEDSGSDEAGGSTREDERATRRSVKPAPSRPVCRWCDQTVWIEGDTVCGDCIAAVDKRLTPPVNPLDIRIAAARKADPDPTDEWRAWATPSAEGESW